MRILLLVLLVLNIHASDSNCENAGERFNVCQIVEPTLQSFLRSNFASDMSCIASATELENNGANIPQCDGSDLQFLDNTHPTGGIFIGYTRDNLNFLSELSQATLSAGAKVNNVIDSVNVRGVPEDDSEVIDPHVLEPQTDLSYFYEQYNANPRLKALIDSGQVNIVPVNATESAVRWMQDSMQFSTLDQSPAILQLEQHSERSGQIPLEQRIACQIAQNCNLPIMQAPYDRGRSEFLESENELNRGTLRAGGNLEIFPGGVIATGGSERNGDIRLDGLQGRVVNNAQASSEQPMALVDTSFLHVGHIDEIYNSLRIGEEQRVAMGLPEQCNFVILEASPRKAMEIIQPASDAAVARDEAEIAAEMAREMTDEEIEAGVAATQERENQVVSLLDRVAQGEYRGEIRRTQALGEYLSLPLYCNDLNERAIQFIAQGNPLPQASIQEVVNRESCIGMSGEYVSVYHWDEDKRNHNLEIQAIQDQNRVRLLSEIRNSTGCENPPVIEVPILFEEGLSLLPDSVNGVVVTNGPNGASHFITPRTFYEPFDNYLREQLTEYGIGMTQVDDLSYHINYGEVHCGSNTALVCKEK